jgi:uncharacterized protein
MTLLRMALALLLLVQPLMPFGALHGVAHAAKRAQVVPVTIRTPRATHRFRVEVARTPDEQARGLMFRAALAPDAGMIFPMTPPRVASFWMKNTLIPLDIIFIRADGRIANIIRNTVPYSLAPLMSEGPVAAVLEVAGGRTAALGIKPGDTVLWTDTR